MAGASGQRRPPAARRRRPPAQTVPLLAPLPGAILLSRSSAPRTGSVHSEIDRGGRDGTREARRGTRKGREAAEEGVERTAREVEGSHMRATHDVRLRRMELAMCRYLTRMTFTSRMPNSGSPTTLRNVITCHGGVA